MPRDTCDKCGSTDEETSWFAPAFREAEAKNGHADPGNLCDSCAGKIVGARIGVDMSVEAFNT